LITARCAGSRGAGKVAEGDLTARVELDSTDELGQMARRWTSRREHAVRDRVDGGQRDDAVGLE
jgi:methyl-accepting chemotaxis protein